MTSIALKSLIWEYTVHAVLVLHTVEFTLVESVTCSRLMQNPFGLVIYLLQ